MPARLLEIVPERIIPRNPLLAKGATVVAAFSTRPPDVDVATYRCVGQIGAMQLLQGASMDLWLRRLVDNVNGVVLFSNVRGEVSDQVD